ncbi:MAG TPA: iron-sulfur cluster-binding domain-containing protein, partial [bacterium]|nr:iron-sulfur cluster-binding domain-containing protein [bacterium]
TFFVCGPQEMYRFLDAELEKLNLPRRLIRREAFGEVTDPAAFPGYPAAAVGKSFTISAEIGDELFEVPANSAESVLVAFERAKLSPPSQCRSGECGFCRALLLEGDVFITPENDGRRLADKKFGYIHPCASYPVSDMKVRILRGA